MDERQLLAELRGLRVATVGGRRAAHKPLLILWLLKNFIDRNALGTLYSDAEKPVGDLIKTYAPGAGSAADLAATPFVHLERSLWHVFDHDGTTIPATPTQRGTWLKARGARGELSGEFVELINTPKTLYAVIDTLLDEYFEPETAERVRAELNLRISASSAPLLKKAPRTTKQITLSLGDEPPLKRLRLPADFASFDRDTRLRWEAFVWLTDVIREKGRRLPARDLRGFSFEGKDMQLIDQQGIWKPAGLTAPLSVRTTYTPPHKRPPYEDDEGADGLIRYKYRGTDPEFFSNVALRRAMTDQRPLIWFKAVAKSVYEPYFPFWVVADEPENLQIAGSFTPPPNLDPAWDELVRQT